MKREINRKLMYALLSVGLALGLCFVFSLSQNKAFANPNKYGNYVHGKAIVCVEGGASTLNSSNNVNALGSFKVNTSLMTLDSSREMQELIGAYSSNLKNQLYNINPRYTLNNSNKKCEILLVDCEDTVKFVENASKVNCILWAQPDYIMQPDEAEESPSNNSTDSNLDGEVDDPLFKYQWAYDPNNMGGNVNLNALETWNAEESEKGDFSTVVAVIDTGVDYSHPDLKDNMWSDGSSIPALTALGGGAYGLNAVEGEDSADPMDTDSGHGTHCASSIASPFNNIGVRGVNGNNAKIMGCRFMNSGGGPTSGAIKCFNYIITAKKSGVNVCCISNSWGDSDDMTSPNFALESITNEAGLNGIVSCFSAGNDSRDLDDYPYRTLLNPYTINVGSCDDYGYASSFSNYGLHTVDVFSPGNRMLNCVSSCKDLPASKRQYISWVNPEEDSYFHEDFETVNPKITLSSHKVGEINNDIYGEVNVDDKCATVDLSSYNPKDVIHVELDISKNDLSSLIQSGDSPYLSFLYQLQDVEIVDDRFGIRYDDHVRDSLPPLSTTWVVRYNHDRDICILDLDNSDFYKVEGDKVTLDFELRIKSKGANPEFKLYDFGFGKRSGIYGYKNGTSMACPVVAGVVSHVYPRMHATSSEDVKQVLAYVKGSTADSEILSDKSINPGMINLKDAYDAVTGTPTTVHPVVESIETTLENNGNYEVVLHGYFFGTSKPSLSIDGSSLDASKITYWSDKEIRFNIPTCSEHLSQVVVTRSDSKTGRNFFMIGEGTSDFVNLPVSNITYNLDGCQIKSSDLNVLKSATTDNAMYCLYGGTYGVDSGLMIIERFDYNTSTWSAIDLSALNILISEDNYYFSMASGKDEIYLLYLTKDNTYKLATYSETANSFVYDVDINCAHHGDMIGNVNGELLLMGKVTSLEKNREADVVKIYPDTGNVYENIGDFPIFDDVGEDPEYNDVACGNVSVYDNKIYISDRRDMFVVNDEGSVETQSFGGPLIFNGSEWILGDGSMYYYVRDQMIRTASGAISTGLISSGIWNESNANELKDTWTYDVNNDVWNLTSYKFSDVKNRSLTGVCHNNNFYVLGQRSIVGDVVFRYLPLQKIGADSQNVTTNVVKEINPEPTPEPIPIDPSAATGDSHNGIISLAIVLFLSLFLFYYLRKSRIKL